MAPWGGGGLSFQWACAYARDVQMWSSPLSKPGLMPGEIAELPARTTVFLSVVCGRMETAVPSGLAREQSLDGLGRAVRWCALLPL